MIKSTQIPRLIVCVTIISAILLPITGMTQDQSQDNPPLAIKWIEGPCTAEIGDWAIINVPEGYIFCKGDDTRKIMESMGNVPSHEEEGFLADAESDWYIVFEFSEIGYVRDDEKDTLDIDAMLESIKKGTEKSNKYRKKRGFPSISVTGWEVEPHYDEITNNLEWAIRGEDEYYYPFVNYNIRYLGRNGVMSAILVADPEQLETIIPVYKSNLESFEFKAGKKYAEFRKGDKIAKYGLSALIVGAGAAVAVKSGLAKYIWKILIFVFAGIAALFRKIVDFFKGLFKKNY